MAPLTGPLAALLYAFCSTAMAFLNKSLMSEHAFSYPFFIMLTQMLVTITWLELCCVLSIFTLPRYSFARGYTFFLPSLFYALHAVLSLSALSSMNIPMYGALKRCTPLVNLILGCCLLGKGPPSKGVIYSVLMITVGCLIAGVNDLTFDAQAYTLCIASVLAQALYQTLVQKSGEAGGSVLEILQLNSYNTLPFFVVASLLFGENLLILQAEWNSMSFVFIFLAVSTMGGILNYSLFLCTTLNSALTTSLVGVAKSVGQTVIGFFVFGGVPVNPLNILGIVLNTLGGIMYTYVKYRESVNKARTLHVKSSEPLLGEYMSSVKSP